MPESTSMINLLGLFQMSSITKPELELKAFGGGRWYQIYAVGA